jgi:hypothetical protein
VNQQSAISLTAWLWDVHPELVTALARQIPSGLGQCFGCDMDLFSSVTCDFTGVADPSALTCISTVDPASLAIPQLSCDGSALNSLSMGCGTGIKTIDESCLTPVPTCAVTVAGGCDISFVSCSDTTSSAAGTGNALSNVAGFLSSGAGLTALAKVAQSYFQAQAASSAATAAQAKAAQQAAATQQAILSAQTARAVTGESALPITYEANGATGGTVPMISTNNGLVPLTESILSSLTPSSIEVFFAQYGTWILVGGAAAFLAYAASRRRST